MTLCVFLCVCLSVCPPNNTHIHSIGMCRMLIIVIMRETRVFVVNDGGDDY